MSADRTKLERKREGNGPAGPAGRRGPRRLVSVLVAALIVAGAAGCEFPLAASGDLDFEVLDSRLSGSLESSAEVRAVGNRVEVTGSIVTPDPCQEIRARFDDGVDPTLLEVVAVSDQDVGCVGAIARFDYRATITGLEAGVHRVRVVHDYRNTGWEKETVTEEQVEVTR